MKKILLAIVSVLATGGMLSAQQQIGGSPYTVAHQMSDADVPLVQMPALDMEKVRQEDDNDEKNGQLQLYSRLHHVDLDIKNSGDWTELANGDRLWRLKIASENALALNVTFSKYHMPAGGKLFIFNEDRSYAIGAFTEINNKDHGRLATGNVNGDAIILEYYEPAAVRGQGNLELDFVGHCYRFIAPVTEAEVSRADDCEVRIQCPEGDDYWDERRAVVRIAVVSPQGQGWCTGSLVNNTAQDCKNYILTALHCGSSSSTANFNDYIFYFNYQQPTCNGGIAQPSQSITGCTRRADSNDNGGNSGSDFLLVELNSDIPDAYQPYWLGWDVDGTGSPNGVCIHHPAGSPKYISTYTSALTTTGWGVGGTHWRVYWSATANGHGVTEGGSSGSPILDDEDRIVGTLTGGSSYCNSVQPGGQNQPDAYGKMDRHWTGNPNSAAEKLKEWLDPINSGVEIMDGSFSPCGATTSIGEEALERAIELYPNPSEGQINLNIDLDNVEGLVVNVYSATGQLVRTISLTDQMQTVQIDLADQADGLYYVNIHNGNYTVTKKVSIVR